MRKRPPKRRPSGGRGVRLKKRSPVRRDEARPLPVLPRAPRRPKVAVVVLNYNGVSLLWNCLFSLKTQDYPNYSVLLVDNASRDGSVRFVKENYPGVKVLECAENFGFALGNNLGVQAARDADLVAILNNDTVVPPEWLSRLVAFHQAHEDAGAVMALVRDRGVPAERYARNGTLNLLGHRIPDAFDSLSTVFYPTGCAFLYDPKRMPGPPFDPDYFLYHEDVLFGWRCRLKGLQVYQEPEAKVFHAGSATVKRTSSRRVHYLQERNRYINLLTCYGAWTLLRLLPWFALDMAARLAYALVTARRSVLGTLGAYLWLPLHLPTLWRKRKRVQAERRVGDRAILPYLSGKLLDGDNRLVDFLNDLSLLYCQLTGLNVLELEKERGQRRKRPVAPPEPEEGKSDPPPEEAP